MPEVSCTVANCKYWSQSNQCHADHIVVQSDAQGGFASNAQLDQLVATPAGSEDETCCQTFKNK